MRHEDGLRRFADAYDGYIVDLWGVVHDGVSILPGAAGCLAEMRRQGKRIVLLSNAPRRVHAAAAQLASMGIDASLYDGLITSGEITRRMLQARTHPILRDAGDRMFVIGPARDRNLVEGLALTEVADIEAAGFVLNTGPNDEDPEAIEAFVPILRRGAEHDIPMVCANPDLEIIRAGQRVICAGALARIYVELGGRCCLVGKPHPEVYPPSLDALGTAQERTVAIGDALATDMAGAAGAGIDGIWVLGGIHNELLGDPDAAERAVAALATAPVGTLPGLIW